MDWLGALETAGLVCLGAVVLLVIMLLVRRQVIVSHGGVFDCGLRTWRGDTPGGWALGMARYSGNNLKWYRMFALIPRHSLKLYRDDLMLAGSRSLDAFETLQLYDDQVVVQLEAGPDGVRRDLSMSRQSLMGFASWLEAAPVGYRYGDT